MDRATELYQSGMASKIAVCGYTGKVTEGFVVSSGAQYKQNLVQCGIPEEAVVLFQLATEIPPSTDAEARGVVRLAKKLGWQSLFVVVPPLHAVRAFVSTVAPTVREYPELMVYSYPARTPNWTEGVWHSETAPKARRTDQLPGELAKMMKYYEKGDHLSIRDVLDYLDHRDA